MARSVIEIVDSHIRSGKLSLPVMNQTAQKLQDMLQDRELDIAAMERLASQDPVLAGAIIELSNSTFYVGMDKVSDAHEAIMRLGAFQVARLASVVAHKANFAVKTATLRPVLRQLWVHSVASAAGSQWLVEKLGQPGLATDAFLLGMVHDLGRLVVLRATDELIRSRPSFSPNLAAVTEAMDSLHTAHGVEVVRGWGLKEELVKATLEHHEPPGPSDSCLLSVLRMVDLTCHKRGIGLTRTNVDLTESPEAAALDLNRRSIGELETALEAAIELANAG